MGSYLAQPQVELEIEEDKDNLLIGQDQNNTFYYAGSKIQGWRMHQEDDILMCNNFNGLPNTHLFAVFDGHGGPEVAIFAAQNFQKFLSLELEKPQFKDFKDIPNMLESTFYAIDNAVKNTQNLQLIQDQIVIKQKGIRIKQKIQEKKAEQEDDDATDPEDEDLGKMTDEQIEEWATKVVDEQITQFLVNHQLNQVGATANVVLIHENQVYCSNIGDSRAALGQQNYNATTKKLGKFTNKEISKDHKPANQDEQDRIKAAGGFVNNGRVNGVLAVSRALGDYEYKKCETQNLSEADKKKPENFIVCAKPDNQKHVLNFPETRFLFMACDGIWEVNDSKIINVMDFIQQKITHKDFTNKPMDLISGLIFNI